MLNPTQFSAAAGRRIWKRHLAIRLFQGSGVQYNRIAGPISFRPICGRFGQPNRWRDDRTHSYG